MAPEIVTEQFVVLSRATHALRMASFCNASMLHAKKSKHSSSTQTKPQLLSALGWPYRYMVFTQGLAANEGFRLPAGVA